MEKNSVISFPRYIIISPVKDEERYVEFTLQSVTQQTLRPVLWIIVDDGSKDRTWEIAKRYALADPVIRLIRNANSSARKAGAAVIKAFKYGFNEIANVYYDFVVKLDCDLSFEPDYFEKLLLKFAADKRLGIASGIYMEQNNFNRWEPILMPSYHTAGACKVLRAKCFEEIEGFIAEAGWDTVDEIRAMARGWKTAHFNDLRMKHHKREGSGVGMVKTSIMHGRTYYRTGGSLLFFLLKVLHRFGAKPYIISAIALSCGYLRAFLKREALLVTQSEAKIYRKILNERLRKAFKASIV